MDCLNGDKECSKHKQGDDWRRGDVHDDSSHSTMQHQVTAVFAFSCTVRLWTLDSFAYENTARPAIKLERRVSKTAGRLIRLLSTVATAVCPASSLNGRIRWTTDLVFLL